MKKVRDIPTEDVAKLTALVMGPPGSGKTHFAATFPDCLILSTEAEEKKNSYWFNPSIKKNVVGEVPLIPHDDADTERVFDELSSSLTEAKELYEKGEIKTLVLDNMTYLAQNRWNFINKYQEQRTKSGEINKMAMYAELNNWLYRFTLMGLLTFPGHLVVTCHEMMESDEVLAKKPDKSSPILPNILGGFRDKVMGMFSCVLYLTKLEKGKGKYRYMARCNKGGKKNAKNRYNLPPVIEDISYQAIMGNIKDNTKS